MYIYRERFVYILWWDYDQPTDGRTDGRTHACAHTHTAFQPAPPLFTHNSISQPHNKHNYLLSPLSMHTDTHVQYLHSDNTHTHTQSLTHQSWADWVSSYGPSAADTLCLSSWPSPETHIIGSHIDIYTLMQIIRGATFWAMLPTTGNQLRHRAHDRSKWSRYHFFTHS